MAALLADVPRKFSYSYYHGTGTYVEY
eukprot:COSAG01_NODE_70606_length_258_cov_0.647799_1_plen_26_part_01